MQMGFWQWNIGAIFGSVKVNEATKENILGLVEIIVLSYNFNRRNSIDPDRQSSLNLVHNPEHMY